MGPREVSDWQSRAPGGAVDFRPPCPECERVARDAGGRLGQAKADPGRLFEAAVDVLDWWGRISGRPKDIPVWQRLRAAVAIESDRRGREGP